MTISSVYSNCCLRNCFQNTPALASLYFQYQMPEAVNHICNLNTGNIPHLPEYCLNQ